ncbi:hypothetical protein QG37_04554 [Candidozyma auris]|nr:hypothetical protein QG37_04554 [[Candida] auris]
MAKKKKKKKKNKKKYKNSTGKFHLFEYSHVDVWITRGLSNSTAFRRIGCESVNYSEHTERSNHTKNIPIV